MKTFIFCYFLFFYSGSKTCIFSSIFNFNRGIKKFWILKISGDWFQNTPFLGLSREIFPSQTTKRYYNFPRIWPVYTHAAPFKLGDGACTFICTQVPGGSTSLSVSDPVKISWSRQFCPVDPRYTSVIHPFPCLSVIVRSICGQCPAHLRFTRWLSGRSPVACQVHQSKTGCERTSTGQGTLKCRPKRILGAQ